MRARLLTAAACAAVVPVVAVVSETEAIVPLPPAYRAEGVVVQSDGRTLIAYDAVPSSHSFNLLRLGVDGSLDASFGGDGTIETQFDGHPVSVSDVAMLSDGRIVAGGVVETSLGDTSFAVARYRPDGGLDPTFTGDGTAVTDFGILDAGTPSIALGPDGAIVAAAQRLGHTDSGVLVARYRPDGSADGTFDHDGKVALDLPGGEEVNGVALDQAGRTVVVGGFQPPGSRRYPFVLRLLPNGELDPTFGVGGITSADNGVGNEYYNSVAIQPDGRIVASGAASGIDFIVGYTVVSRYLPTGAPDPSFGAGGHVLVPAESTPPAGLDVSILRDGRIAVAANTKLGDADATLTVLTPAGVPDARFGGGDGVYHFDFASDGRLDEVGGLAAARNGKLVVVGTHRPQQPFEAPRTLGLAAVPSIDV